jgi:multiple sugar transport system permease protein
MATETEGQGLAAPDSDVVIGTTGGFKDRVLLWTDDHLKWLLTLPSVVILFALTFYPLLRALEMSTKRFLPANRQVFVGIENYTGLLANETFITSLGVTAKFIGLAVGLEFLLGFGIALLLNKKLKFRGLWQTLILIPMILSPTVIGLIWRLLYTPDGLLDYIANATGLVTGNVGWISEPSIALYSVILTDVWQWTPLVVLVMFAGLQSIPSHVREAAIMDGAGPFQRFRDITLPYLQSLIVLVLIIRVVDALRVFAIRFSSFGEASAMAVSLLVVVLILAMTFVKTVGVEF